MTSPEEKLGSPGSSLGSPLRSSMGGPLGFSYPTYIFGKAQSGWQASGSLTTTSPVSGSATVTTIMATPGSNNATKATDRDGLLDDREAERAGGTALALGARCRDRDLVAAGL
jgi:hypothetical protein